MKEEVITPLRTKWESAGAPRFTAQPGDFLAGTIPDRESLSPYSRE